MASVRELLRIVVEADTDGAVRGISNVGKVADRDLGRAEQRIDKVGAGFRKAGALMLGAGAVMVGGLIKTIGAASDLNEAVNVTGLVFGDASDEMGDFAKNAAQGLGLSETAARQATAQFGGLLKNLGFAQGETVTWSKDLTTLAADMGSAFNTSTEDAIMAIGAGLRGESEPLKQFNVFLSETELKTKAVEMGLAATTGEVDRNAKAQAALATIMEQTVDVQNDFANTSDGAANASKIAAAEFENAKASLGTALLPVVSKGAGLLSDLAAGFVSVNEASGGMLSNIALGTTAFLLIGGTIASAVGQIIKMRDVLDSATTKFGRFASSAVTFAAQAGAIAGGMFIVADALANITRGKLDVEGFAKDLELLARTGEGFSANEVVDWFEAIAIGGPKAGKGIAHLKFLDDALAGFVESGDADLAAELVDRFNSALAESGLPLGEVTDRLPKYSKELELVAARGSGIGGILRGMTGALRGLVVETDETTDAVKELNDALKAQFDPLFAAQDALLDNKDAQAEYTRTAKEARAAQDKVTEATRKFGPESKQAKEATVAHKEALNAHAESGRKVARTALDVSSATTELSRKMESGELTTKGMKDQLKIWVAQGLLTEEQAERVAGDLQRVGDRAKNIDGTQVRLGMELRGHEAVENMLNTIARHRTSVVSVVGSGPTGQLSGGLFRQSGGPIPGPPGQAVPFTGHGGEFVLSADVVDAIKHDRPTRGLGASASIGTGGGLTINGNLNIGSRDDLPALDFWARTKMAGV